MKIKKDLFLNILYSVLFTIVILLTNSSLSILEVRIAQILKNFILIAILLLWLKSLSRSNLGVILIMDKSTLNKHLAKSGFSLIKDFIEIKIAVFILIFPVISFFFESITIGQLSTYLIQIFTVCLYTLSCYLISLAYLKISIDNWKFILLIFSPYFLFFIFYEIMNLENTLYFALIPSNFSLLTRLHSDFSFENRMILIFSSLIFFITIVSIFISIRKLSSDRKQYKLPIERSN